MSLNVGILALGLGGAPYDAWHGAQFREPAPLGAERLPAPLAEPPERARRPFELSPELGLSLPQCVRHAGPGCAELAFGQELGLEFLLRPLPGFAFGVEGRRFVFNRATWERADTTSADALFLGLAARAYFLDRGRFDPYLHLSLGGGSLTVEGAGRAESVELSPALRSAAGCDVVLTSWLRAGAFLGWTRYFPASVSRCGDGACSAVTSNQSGVLIGATSLGLRITISAGEPH